MEHFDTLLFFAASVLNIIDAVQTLRFYKRDMGCEANPVLSYLLATDPRLAFIIKVIAVPMVLLTVLLPGLTVFRASCLCGIGILVLAIAFNNLQLQ